MIEDIKNELSKLENKKNQIEKEIAINNAKRDAILEMLLKEFGIKSEEEIEVKLKELEEKLTDEKDKLTVAVDKLRVSLTNLEAIVNGRN